MNTPTGEFDEVQISIPLPAGGTTRHFHVFALPGSARSWTDAQAVCEIENGHLAKVDDSVKNDLSLELNVFFPVPVSSGSETPMWIGLMRGDWNWEDGKKYANM